MCAEGKSGQGSAPRARYVNGVVTVDVAWTLNGVRGDVSSGSEILSRGGTMR